MIELLIRALSDLWSDWWDEFLADAGTQWWGK